MLGVWAGAYWTALQAAATVVGWAWVSGASWLLDTSYEFKERAPVNMTNGCMHCPVHGHQLLRTNYGMR